MRICPGPVGRESELLMHNPHFLSAATWREAQALVTFAPVEPRDTAGFALQGLRIHVRDHRMRDLAPGDRTLEAHYGGFVLSQARGTAQDARRRALETRYGAEATDIEVAGHAGKSYELGPEPPPDDVDGRMPAVVVWSDGEMFYLVASGELAAKALLGIARSLYGSQGSAEDETPRTPPTA